MQTCFVEILIRTDLNDFLGVFFFDSKNEKENEKGKMLQCEMHLCVGDILSSNMCIQLHDRRKRASKWFMFI
jgi:hypothetical protein